MANLKNVPIAKRGYYLNTLKRLVEKKKDEHAKKAVAGFRDGIVNEAKSNAEVLDVKLSETVDEK